MRLKQCISQFFMKFRDIDLTGRSLFAPTLDELISKKDPIREKLDRLEWNELETIAQEAYSSEWGKEMPNPRIMIGLFVYSCFGDKTYEEIAADFSYHILCQYACGFTSFERREIDETTLLKFEQRLGEENIMKIKDIIERQSIDNQPPRSKGKHTFDTTCLPSNIEYPTDTKLMETVRSFLVSVITEYEKEVGQSHRHYGRVAREEYVGFCKKRRPPKNILRKMKKSQLQYLRRNLRQAEEVIEALEKRAEKGSQKEMRNKKEKKYIKTLKTKLRTARDISDQQKFMYDHNTNKVENRIVSFHRPEIRPIFRGKSPQPTEFGMKAGVSLCGKTIILGKLEYENYHDGKALGDHIRSLDQRGIPMKEAIADKGCSGQRRLLKEKNIRDGVERRGNEKVREKPIPKKRYVRERNRMEGAFGVLSRCFLGAKMRAKTTLGEFRKINKAFIGYNLRYAL